jgi:hypothetical protein
MLGGVVADILRDSHRAELGAAYRPEVRHWHDRPDRARLLKLLVTGYTLDLSFVEQRAVSLARGWARGSPCWAMRIERYATLSTLSTPDGLTRMPTWAAAAMWTAYRLASGARSARG